MRQGKITEIRLFINDGRLRAVARIKCRGETVDADMPGREIATLLPKCVLAGSEKTLPRKFLAVLVPILRRMTIGRTVEVVNNRKYKIPFFHFLTWTDVRFEEAEEEVPAQGV